MLTSVPATRVDRTALRLRYLNNRNRSAELFALVDPATYLDRPIPLRHPLAFYEGHLPAFSYNKLCREALGEPSIDATFERIFERGIDPSDSNDAARHERDEWPSAARIAEFAAGCDAGVLRALETADITDVRRSPMLDDAQAAYCILEHEELHHETLLYILHRIPLERKRRRGRESAFLEREPLETGRATVPAGHATLGATRDEFAFGWDNEFDQSTVAVDAFEIDRNDVTNGDWLAFVRAGGPVPSFWRERDGGFALLGMFEEMPLPLTWPVYVTNQQAKAYAAWRGSRLPTEAEYHRAAFGTPHGDERAFPWGAELPNALHGNFGGRRYDPQPVGIDPAGASAWGVYDLIGNGWEWTSTPFAPFAGFEPLASYPQYSADFFDDEHVVMKGASPVTNRNQIRRSFRNWYRADYPYVYATFRTVD